jgi:hypothetical protein
MSGPARSGVVAAGGGAAGAAAAIGAQRARASVRPAGRYPFPGGAAAISSLPTFCGFSGQRREQAAAGIGGSVMPDLTHHMRHA